MHLQSEFVLYK